MYVCMYIYIYIYSYIYIYTVKTQLNRRSLALHLLGTGRILFCFCVLCLRSQLP